MFNPLTLVKAAGSFLGGIQTYLIVGAVSGALAFGGGIWLEAKIKAGEINAIKLADANNTIAAIQAAKVVQQHEAEVAIAAAVREASRQENIVTRTVTVTKEINHYVHDQVRCPGPTVGLARVLRAAAGLTDPAALQLAPGQSDDDCSDVTPSEVAGWFTAYAGAAQANTEQLTALQSWVLDDHKAQEQTK